eukprot:372450_1
MGLQDQVFQLKFTAKSLNRQSVKSEKDSKAAKKKIKTAMEKGNMEGARIHAQDSIRLHSQSLNYLKLASRIDAVAARVDSAAKMQTLTKSMGKVVKSMGSAMKSMNVQKISTVMDQFEKQFEDLDLTTEFMESAIDSTQAASMPQEDVTDLMNQVADEHGLEVQEQLSGGQKILKKEKKSEENEVNEEDLEARLKRLQG